MKITSLDEESILQISRKAALANGPVLPMAYSSTGKTFRVKRVTVKYVYQGGEWVAASRFSVDLSGPVLKKDGTDSKSWHTSHPEWDWRGNAYLPVYAFAEKIVDMLRPQGGVAMIGYLEHEVEV